MIKSDNPAGRGTKEIVQFLPFRVAIKDSTCEMVLNIQKIREVIEYQNLDSIPDPRQHFLGLINLRGSAIPVLNLSQTLTFAAPSANQKANSTELQPQRVLICDLQGISVGVPVVSTERIVTCASEDFLPPPPAMAEADSLFFSGLIALSGRFVPLLDLDGLVQVMGLGSGFKEVSSNRRFLGKRVLVVEDSKSIRLKLAQLFQGLGFEVLLAGNGREGVAILEQEQNRVDLIFTDIEMPLMDGIALARSLRSKPETAHLPILFNSSLSNPHLISDIQQEGLGRYLIKFNSDEIVRHVEQAMELEPKAA